jgi:CDGSH-type Zn-finger protein
MPLSYEDLIAPTIVRQVSKSVAYCRCTRSKNLPFCDGSHAVTSIRPHILEFDEPTTIAICRCWKSKDHPYCDGTHGRLVPRAPPTHPTENKRLERFERQERLNERTGGCHGRDEKSH